MQMIVCGFLFAVISKIVLTDEDTRLINGQNRLEGELQVLKDGIWSYACYDSWNTMNTKVMCRMLSNNTYRESYGPSGAYRTCMYNITCSGTEHSINECMKGVAYKSCLLYETVSVRCGGDKVTSTSPGLHGIGVRLVDGYNQNEGKVEIGINGTWRSVANTNNSWGNKEANVICSMLGYRTNNATGFHTPTLTQVQCIGNETSFDFCSFKKENACASTYHVYLFCSCSSNHCQGSSTPYCDRFLGTCEAACSPGRYVSSANCFPCNPGTYQPATNQNRCYYCPFGTYQNLTGQSSCQACPVGKYVSMIGSQTTCNACPPGTYQDQTGQISCKQCSIGTYQNMVEQAACIPCEPGTYQNSSGKTICIPCAGGNTTNRLGSTTQYECYKALSQRDDLLQQTNFDILIVGATLLAGVFIFDIISCAILMRITEWKSKNSNNIRSDIHRPSLKHGCETASMNDTLNSSRSQNLQVNNGVRKWK
ncbi:hypothetical protein CHS0354_021360 [Potamilus streckersoni]|uniref:SRCR domain-containing protein n=1 Tax=Potamilus streckersoni TaxID=2493646 RepID=A0AAE0S3I1_9BIVA|nr:hypothetical protein CHS0354_021360 [Potamilus streckersoni]